MRAALLLVLLCASLEPVLAKDLWEYDKEFPKDAQADPLPYENHLFSLDASNLEQALDTLDYILVMFTSIEANARHLEIAEHNYELIKEAAAILAQEGTEKLFGVVNGEDLMQYYHLGKGQFGVFTKGADAKSLEFTHYQGDPYSAAGMAQFVRRARVMSSVCEELADFTAVVDFVAKNSPAVVVFYDENEYYGEALEEFKGKVTKHAEVAPNVMCGLTSDEDAMKKYGAAAQSASLFVGKEDFQLKNRDFLPGIGIGDLGPNGQYFAQFLHRYSRPTVLTYNPKDQYELFWDPAATQLILFADAKQDYFGGVYEEFEAAAEAMRPEGKYRSIIPAHMDSIDQADQAWNRHWVLAEHGAQVRLYQRVGRGNYKQYDYPEGKEITKKGLLMFAATFASGNLLPGESPEVSEIPKEGWKPDAGKFVSTVVRADARKFVDQKKDVLIMYFSPSCMHCKSFLPEYESLAESVKDVESLAIGKLNVKSNMPLNPNIRGIPTIELYPAYNKGKPVTWDKKGGPTKEALFHFLALQAHITFDVAGKVYGQGREDPDNLLKTFVSDDEFDEL